MLKFLGRESKTVIGAATLVGLLSFVSRFIGFIRDRVLAGAFGAGDTLDVYYAAFKVPDLLYMLIVVGAVSASFIPLFLSHYKKPLGSSLAWKFTNNSIHLVGGIILIASVLLMIFAPFLAGIVAPGFNMIKQARVASFMRVMFIAQVILAVSMIYGSVLQSLKKFFLFSLAPIFYNLGIIVGAVWLVDIFGTIGLAWGVVLGALLHLATQLYGVLKSGYHYEAYMDISSKDTRKMLRLMGPRTIGLAVGQLMFLLLTIIASTLVAGSVTIFQFAYNIQFFAVGIVGVSFAIAVFPSLSEKAQAGEMDGFIDTVASATKQLIYLLVPMTLLFLILRAQIVRVVVGAGAFDWGATIATADTLAFFTLTFVPQALVFLLARAFYALHDTLTPLIIAIVAAFTGILSAFLLRDDFGVIALSIAYSIAAIVNAALLWISLRQRTGTLRENSILQTIWKVTVGGMGAGLVMQLLKPVVTTYLSLDTFVGVLSQGLIAGGAGIIIYVTIMRVLKLEEQKNFFASLRRKTMAASRPEEVVTEGSLDA